MCGAFEAVGLSCAGDIPVPTPLCQHHYYLVYGVLQSRQTHCTTCGTRITQNNHRPCPNPDAIAKHLQDKAGFEGEIHANDRVCIPCYKSQLVILQELQIISTNSDLELIISTLSLQIPTIDTVKTLPDVVKVAMAKTAIFVGNLLLDKINGQSCYLQYMTILVSMPQSLSRP